MKKLLSFVVVALLGLGSARAQDLPIKVTCEGKEIDLKGGETLTFMARINDFGYVTMGPETDPTITNVTDEAIELTCTISTSAFNKFGDFYGKGNLSWCGFKIGNCVTFDTKETHTCTLAPGESTDMQFHCLLTSATSYGTIRASVKFSEDGNDLGGYTSKFVNPNPAGIENATANGGNGVSVANGTLSYSFATAAARRISVFAVDGKLVKDASVSAKSGSVSLKSLQAGAYVYTVSQNGKNVQSGKVLVK